MGKLFPALRDYLSRFIGKLSWFLPRHGGISSRSLPRKAGLLNFCSCIRNKFVMAVTPGHPTSLRYVGQSAHLHAILILHHDKFLAPRQFVPRLPTQLRFAGTRLRQCSPPACISAIIFLIRVLRGYFLSGNSLALSGDGYL